MYRVTGLCDGNSSVTGEFTAQRTSIKENIPFDDVIMKYYSKGAKFERNKYETKAINLATQPLPGLSLVSILIDDGVRQGSIVQKSMETYKCLT